ncbi:MAG: ATPase [Sphingosinicella sp.]|nr:ATPase [Sphingosinicella sp.]
MKRFYRSASARPSETGFEILLDDHPVKTPARQPLILPIEKLAEAVAQEWNSQGEKIDPRSMPLTGLANAAIDRVSPDPETFARSLSLYGESDLLCYRADNPAPLMARQSELWDPLLVWARRRFDVEFEIIHGIMHRPQPGETLKRLDQAVKTRAPFELAGLAPLVTIGGSLIVALALAEHQVDLDSAWTTISLDEVWQAEQWGEDAEAAKVLGARRQDFAAAHRFLTLL